MHQRKYTFLMKVDIHDERRLGGAIRGVLMFNFFFARSYKRRLVIHSVI